MKSLKVSKLEGKSLYIATPMYGNQCNGGYMQACMRLQRMCLELGVRFELYTLFNESLVTRARNVCVHEFLKTDYTHMMFIDADIVFDPVDVLKMLTYDRDIMCGPYSKKKIRWDRVMQALSKGSLNLGSKDTAIESFTGDFFFNAVDAKARVSTFTPIEITEAGTGFMMIKRECFKKFEEAYPELKYISDTSGKDGEFYKQEMVAYFDTIIDQKTRRYLSEDYMFCQHSRNIGLKVWLCPWARLQHIGNYTYKGDFPTTINLLS
jgi:hypothetical protein